MKKIHLLLFCLMAGLATAQQKTPRPPKKTPDNASLALGRPKLVVGIVVDQMRYDYLYRYYDKYTSGGFKRLMNEGFNCKTNHYHYAITATGPGHAAVYTGSTPALNGIVGNDWFDRLSGRMVYCVQDTTVQPVGSTSLREGQMSPRNLLTTTITDQLRISNEFKSKVIGIAIKDRGSILPAGHTANAAYWFDEENGNWITSDYYMKQLPPWLAALNAKGWPKSMLNQSWDLLLPATEYLESQADEQEYEGRLPGEKKSVFPHKINTYGALLTSPYGNTMTKELALAVLENERLGRDAATDFLAVSFSSPDYVGHAFGTHSMEVEDTYLRLDRDLAELLTYLDKNIGKGQYLMFLTADHGAADPTGFLRQYNVPTGNTEGGKEANYLNTQLETVLGPGRYINQSMNYQLYLNYKLLRERKLGSDEVFRAARDKVFSEQTQLHTLIDLHHIDQAPVPTPIKELLRNAYHPKRSGDWMTLLEPAWVFGYLRGTTHGTLWSYDRHVPLLWYGWHIPKGETVRQTYIADIAPTLAALLNILEPNGNIGHPIEFKP